MASSSLYAPLVDSYAPAFVAAGGSSYCRLYFSLSKYSSNSSIKAVHVSIVKQTTGKSVVRKVDSPSKQRYRSSGILIINSAPVKVTTESNLYYVDILNEDVQAGESQGWYPGWIYKIQLRLSTVTYSGSMGQSAWLTANGNNFSEWSTYCTTKAISQPVIQIPLLNNFDSSSENAG